MRLLRDWLVYLAVRLLVCLVQAVTIETCQWAARALAVLAGDVLRLRQQVVDDNLRHVFPDYSERQRRELARGMWQHLFLMVCEIAHVPRKIHETNYRRYLRMEQVQQLCRYMIDPRPKVVVSGHFGNFEVASYALGLLGFPSYAIARRLDNPFLDRFLHRFRAANGQFILPKVGSAKQVEAVLESGGTLALLGDQHAGGKGCWVDFLGRPASCHKAIALFTLTSGAPLMVAYAQRRHRPLQFDIGIAGIADPLGGGEHLGGVKPLTQWYNDRLEEVIRSTPQQYWWVHRRWKDTPHRRRRKAKAAAATQHDRPAA